MAILSMAQLTEEQRVYYTSLLFKHDAAVRALQPPPEPLPSLTPWERAKQHLDAYLYECSCDCHEDEDY